MHQFKLPHYQNTTLFSTRIKELNVAVAVEEYDVVDVKFNTRIIDLNVIVDDAEHDVVDNS